MSCSSLRAGTSVIDKWQQRARQCPRGGDPTFKGIPSVRHHVSMDRLVPSRLSWKALLQQLARALASQTPSDLQAFSHLKSPFLSRSVNARTQVFLAPNSRLSFIEPSSFSYAPAKAIVLHSRGPRGGEYRLDGQSNRALQ